jgi:hypothetical protein
MRYFHDDDDPGVPGIFTLTYLANTGIVLWPLDRHHGLLRDLVYSER